VSSSTTTVAVRLVARARNRDPQRDDIEARLRTRLNTINNHKRETTARSDVTDLLDKVVELLLGVGVFLGHLFVLGFPLVAGLFEGLDFAFVVAGFDIGLAEPSR
jgi:hypothetical protein